MKVFVEDTYSYGYRLNNLFREWGYEVVSSLEESDLVILTGGPDINPKLYNQDRHARTSPTVSNRDSAEVALYHEALLQGTPMIGICRGAQLLHVLNGGTLYQDVDGHRGNHKVKCVGFEPANPHKDYMVTSTHHQMMAPQKDHKIFTGNPYEILMTADESTYRDHCTPTGVTLVNTEDDHADLEAIFYPKTQSLCFQGHPEYGTHNCDSVYLFQECARKSLGLIFKD